MKTRSATIASAGFQTLTHFSLRCTQGRTPSDAAHSAPGAVAVAAPRARAMCVLLAPGSDLGQRGQGFPGSGPGAAGPPLGGSRSVAVPFPGPLGGGPVVAGATVGVSRSVAVRLPPRH